MTGVLLGLMLGVGLVLVLAALTRTPRFAIITPGWIQRWSDTVIRSGIPGLTPGRQVGVSLGVSLVAFLLVMAWTGTRSVAGIIALVCAPLPSMVVSSRARSRTSRMRACWPDVTDFLISGVRAGSALPEILAELAVSGPEDLRPQFATFAADYRADGRFDRALSRLKDRFADPVADRIVEALRLARDVGGNDLSALLHDLGLLLREDARIRGELEARQSWTVNAARLGVAAPWLVLVMISAQEGAGDAYSRPQGLLVLGIGAVVSVVAYLSMQRLGRLSTDRRDLR